MAVTEEYYLVECVVVQSDRSLPTFRRYILCAGSMRKLSKEIWFACRTYSLTEKVDKLLSYCLAAHHA